MDAQQEVTPTEFMNDLGTLWAKYQKPFWTIVGFVVAYILLQFMLSPSTPANVGFRTSIINQTKVIQVTHTGPKPMGYSFTGGGKDVVFNLSPGQTKELGWAEGFEFNHGDQVWLHAQGCKPIYVKVP